MKHLFHSFKIFHTFKMDVDFTLFSLVCHHYPHNRPTEELILEPKEVKGNRTAYRKEYWK